MTTDVTIYVLLILSIRSLLLKNFIIEWELIYPCEFSLRKVGTTKQFFQFPDAAAMSLLSQFIFPVQQGIAPPCHLHFPIDIKQRSGMSKRTENSGESIIYLENLMTSFTRIVIYRKRIINNVQKKRTAAKQMK